MLTDEEAKELAGEVRKAMQEVRLQVEKDIVHLDELARLKAKKASKQQINHGRTGNDPHPR